MWDQRAALREFEPSRSHLGEGVLTGAEVEPKLVCSLELGHAKGLSHDLA